MGTFDWLTLQEWIAVLRVGVGLWWLESVRHKPLRGFVKGGAMGWVESLTGEDHPVQAYAAFIRKVVLSTPRRRLANSWLVVLGELAVGLSLVLGFLTPVGLAVGLFLNINYLILVGLRDQGEQGQNLMMILAEVVLLGAAAWRVWALDNVLF
ncbi:MAG: DoxX family protein [Acidimicrobiia bacterium]